VFNHAIKGPWLMLAKEEGKSRSSGLVFLLAGHPLAIVLASFSHAHAQLPALRWEMFLLQQRLAKQYGGIPRPRPTLWAQVV